MALSVRGVVAQSALDKLSKEASSKEGKMRTGTLETLGRPQAQPKATEFRDCTPAVSAKCNTDEHHVRHPSVIAMAICLFRSMNIE